MVTWLQTECGIAVGVAQCQDWPAHHVSCMHLSDSDIDSDSLCIMRAHMRMRMCECVSSMSECAYSLGKVTPISHTVCASEAGSSKHSHFHSFYNPHQLLVTSLP